MEKLAGVILMAGSSVRFGGPKNKLLYLLNGKPVFAYSIEAFAKQKNIEELVITVNDDTKDTVQKFVETNNIKAKLIKGGATRQESVENALKALNLGDEDIVVIHDAARPLVDTFIINQVAKAAIEFGAATPYIEALDTIAIKNENEEVSNFVSRASVAQIQTPQAFKFGLLNKAHVNTNDKKATDDCSLILMEGHKVKLVKGDKKLHKITTREDIKYLEGLLK